MTIAGKLLRRLGPAAVGAAIGSVLIPGLGTALGGKLGALLGGISTAGAAAIGGAAGLGLSSTAGKNWLAGTTGSSLTDAQREQNDFTLLQQLRQQEFNSNEAALNRDWQEQMDSTKYQRQTADMQAAGLNPALMYGSSISSAGSLSGGAASSAAPAGASSANVSGGLLDSLINLIFVKQRLSNLKMEGQVLLSQKNKNDADAELARSNRSLADSRTRYTDMVIQYYPRLSESTISKIGAEVQNLYRDLDVKEHSIYKIDSEAALNEARAFVERIQGDWADRLNAAREKNELASAARSFAEAAFQQYSLDFAREHGGQIPGYNMWSGLAASVASALKDMGVPDIDLDNLDWIDLMWPWFSFFRKKNRQNEN